MGDSRECVLCRFGTSKPDRQERTGRDLRSNITSERKCDVVPEKRSRILVVEDETTVRMIGSDALADAGYEVLEAATADEAVHLLESVGEVHVLFTDVRMPGSMNGFELAKLVRERWPEMRILVTSGDTWPPEGPAFKNVRFLAKPYRVDVLQKNVDDLLG
jgi:CheY-like chemotaxis protein